MTINRDEFQTITFLTECVYHDLAYPSYVGMKHKTKKFSGLNAEIFEGKEYNLVVFSGTNFTSIRDWYTNIKMAFGIKPKQFYDALEFFLEWHTPNKKVFISGHSLGGAIAQYVSNCIPDDNVICLTFNGAGIRHLVKDKYRNNIYNFVLTRDILNNITKFLPFKWFKHIGETIIVKDFVSKNGVKSHSNFHVFMEFNVENLQKGVK